MNLVQELRVQIRAYLENRLSLLDLQDWLGTHVQALADDSSAEFQDLSGSAWLLISEWLSCDRGEASVRAELARLVPSVPVS